MRRAAASILPVLVACAAAAAEPAAEPSRDLRALLERMDGVARTFSATALRFECKETIRWDEGPFGRRGTIRFAYIFVRDGERTEDYRTWTGLSGKLSPAEVLPDEQGVPRYLRSAYHWIQIFRSSRWEHHRFFPAGRGTALGRPAIGIRFEPIPPIVNKLNDWYGTAWVDPDTEQILRIEAYTPAQWLRKSSLEEFERDAASLPRDFATSIAIERIDTEFGFERGGLRFPSRVRLRETVHRLSVGQGRLKDRERTSLDVEQRYERYRFFATEAVPVDEEPTPVGR